MRMQTLRAALTLSALFITWAAVGTVEAAGPTLTSNSLVISRGESVTLSRAHIDASDPDTALSALVFTASGVAGGRIERIASPGTPVTTFTGSDLAGQALRFVHDGTMTPTAYSIAVGDGQNSTLPSAAGVTFTHGHSHAPAGDLASALALVEDASATHTAVISGVWSEAATWGGSIPGNGSRIVIPQGLAVVVDAVLTPEFESLRIDGMLRFATDRSTALRIDTLVANLGSRFEIGTPAIPVTAGFTATVTFIDDGNINTNEDFAQIGRGAILAGGTVIHGDTTTSHVAMAVHPTAGTSQRSLAETPVGWDIGDELVITGTIPNNP